MKKPDDDKTPIDSTDTNNTDTDSTDTDNTATEETVITTNTTGSNHDPAPVVQGKRPDSDSADITTETESPTIPYTRPNTTGSPAGDKTQFIKPQNKPDGKTHLRSAKTDSGQTDPGQSHAGAGTQKSVEQEADKAESSDKVLNGRFVLESVLGAGGMGVVYKAKDLVRIEAKDHRNLYVAVKVLSDEFKTHPEAFIALQRESRKTQEIAHPNIVNVHDFARDGDTVFMTMEYLEGKPLDQLIRQYKATGLPKEDAETIIEGMSAALIYAHQQKIIHSDFKPGNVFITKKGIANVFDFGIARAVGQADLPEDSNDDKTVFDAGNLGALTPAYASAEMLDGKEPDPRDDIYALGCIAYELYTGVHPFGRVHANQARNRNLKPKKIPNIGRQQWLAIQKALAFKREDRVASVEEFWALFTKKFTLGVKYYSVLTIVLLAVVAAAVYQFLTPDDNVRLEIYKDDIATLLREPTFSERWQDDLWRRIQGVRKLVDSQDEWLVQTEATIYQLYLEQLIQYRERVAQSLEQQQLAPALELSANGKRYSEDLSEIEALETSIVDLFKDRIVQLRDNPTFEEQWQEALWERIQEMRAVLEKQDEWLVAMEASIFDLYEKQITQIIDQANRPTDLDQSERLIPNAERYTQDSKKIENLKVSLAKRRELLKSEANRIVTAPPPVPTPPVTPPVRRTDDRFNAALNNVNKLLACQGSINMGDLRTAVDKLRSINSAKYRQAEPAIVKSLADCITRIGRTSSRRANDYKKSAQRLFPSNPVINAISIVSRDPCNQSLAGRGRVCRDAVGDSRGPRLVVIPGTGRSKSFAIGKYEVSIGELNQFCGVSSACSPQSGNSRLPATNITLQTANAYLNWLSANTGKKYRLPTKGEWLRAAKATDSQLIPRRTCYLVARGMVIGGALVNASLGDPNPWGLVNHIGNAREWVQDGGRTSAIGGSYATPMEDCNFSTIARHTGNKDATTGFRVLRELSP